MLNCKIGQNSPSPKRTFILKVSHVLTVFNAYTLALSISITAGHLETHGLVQCGKAQTDLEEQLFTWDIGLELLLLLEVVCGYSFIHKALGL